MGGSPDPCEKLPVGVSTRLSCRLGRSLRANLQHLWGNGTLADIYISLKVSQPDGLPATRAYALHKTVLCTSGLFSVKLMGDWADSTSGLLCPEDRLVEFEAFETVLRGLYGFDVRVSRENVLGLLATAAYLQVEDVVENCKKFLLVAVEKVSFQELAQWCCVVWDRRYPYRELILDKCADVLSIGPNRLPLQEMIMLPAEFLAQILKSDNTWMPDECSRVGLVVDVMLSAMSSPQLSKAKHNRLQKALDGVLMHGIQYGCIPEEKLPMVQSKLAKVWDKEVVTDCLMGHMWKTKEFHSRIHCLQPGVLDYDSKLGDGACQMQHGWLRMGGEWSGIDRMISGEARNLRKIYYGGSIWWLQLAYELPGKDRNKDVTGCYGVFLMHEVPRMGDIGGILMDQRDEIKAEIKIACASEWGSMRRRAIWHVKKNRGWGWPQFLTRSKIQKFILPRATLRVAFALRIITT